MSIIISITHVPIKTCWNVSNNLEMFRIMLLLHPRWIPISIASILKFFSSHYKLIIHVYNYLKKSSIDLRGCKFYSLFSSVFEVLEYFWNRHFTLDICWEESVFVERKVVVMERVIWMDYKSLQFIQDCNYPNMFATPCLNTCILIKHVFPSL